MRERLLLFSKYGTSLCGFSNHSLLKYILKFYFSPFVLLSYRTINSKIVYIILFSILIYYFNIIISLCDGGMDYAEVKLSVESKSWWVSRWPIWIIVTCALKWDIIFWGQEEAYWDRGSATWNEPEFVLCFSFHLQRIKPLVPCGTSISGLWFA